MKNLAGEPISSLATQQMFDRIDARKRQEAALEALADIADEEIHVALPRMVREEVEDGSVYVSELASEGRMIYVGTGETYGIPETGRLQISILEDLGGGRTAESGILHLPAALAAEEARAAIAGLLKASQR